MNKILVTGFQPFLGQQMNPSALIAEKLQQDFPEKFVSLILPVEYTQAFLKVHGFLNSMPTFPKKVVLLGQAAGRSQICVERVALNWIESAHADEAGVQSQPRKITPNAPEAYIQSSWSFSNSLCDGKVKVSHSAGTYVCNELYFQMLYHYQEHQKQICFLHLPLLPEQVSDHNPQPSLDLVNQYHLVQKFITEFEK